MTEPFEPVRYLTKLQGKDYLEVRWRLVWLRDKHPDAQLCTTLIEHEPKGYAVFHASIVIPGGGESSGYGSETAGDFRDYLEKAETKAIGRACAALGFGTQFCDDHDFSGTEGRVVDAPVTRPQPPAPMRQQTQPRAVANGQPLGQQEARRAGKSDEPTTQRQFRYLQAVGREAGLDQAGLDERSMREFGVQAQSLTKRDCSTLIKLIPNGVAVEATAVAAARTEARSPGNGVSADQVRAIERMAQELNMVVDDRVAADFNVGSASMLTTEQAGQLITRLGKELAEQRALPGVVAAAKDEREPRVAPYRA